MSNNSAQQANQIHAVLNKCSGPTCAEFSAAQNCVQGLLQTIAVQDAEINALNASVSEMEDENESLRSVEKKAEKVMKVTKKKTTAKK